MAAAATGSLTLKAQKKVLRKIMASKLRELPQAVIEQQSQAASERLLSLPEFKQSKNVSCYLSMPSGELQTLSLASQILRQGKTLFVPKIESKNGHMDFLKVYGLDDLNSLPEGLWGIREPGLEWGGTARAKTLGPESEDLDLILVPGVAFDRGFSRLGHGKGYYDRFFTDYTSEKSKRPLFVALSLLEQLLEAGEVPTEGHDWKVDYIITPNETLSSQQWRVKDN